MNTNNINELQEEKVIDNKKIDELEEMFEVVSSLLLCNPKELGNDYEEYGKSRYEAAQKKLTELLTPAFPENTPAEVEETIQIMAKYDERMFNIYSMQLRWVYDYELLDNNQLEDREKDLETLLDYAYMVQRDYISSAKNKYEQAKKAIERLEDSYFDIIIELLISVRSHDIANHYYGLKYNDEQMQEIIKNLQEKIINDKEEALIYLLRCMDSRYDLPNTLGVGDNNKKEVISTTREHILLKKHK